MPKPNTRFLRNIIKGTDTHNKALLAKEAAESKARLKRLERTEDIKFFNEAINAYQSALLEWTQEKSPMTWAMTAANLAIAQKSLAERLGDAGTAGLALSSFEAVAEVFRSASHARYYQFATEQIAKTRTLLDSLATS